MDLELILSLSGTILGLLITACTFIVKTVNNTKAKHIAEQAIKIGNAVLPFIKEAEKFTSYTGAEKKEYVMTKANQFAIENNIPFNADEVSDKIEELITLTRHVNKKITPQQEAAIKQDMAQVVAEEEAEKEDRTNNNEESTEQEIDDWVNGHIEPIKTAATKSTSWL